MKTETVHFVITGEFVTRHSRDMVLEKRWRDGIDFLLSYVDGVTPDIATEILSGKKAFIGRSDTEITLADDHDEEYKNRLNYIYSSLVLYNNKWYKPYAYVSNYGEKDFPELDPNGINRKMEVGKELKQTRARHYCNDKEHDKIITLYVGKEIYPVLFESTEPPPYWFPTNRDPQVASNFSHLSEYGHIEWYGPSEKTEKKSAKDSDAVIARKLAEKLNKEKEEKKFEPVMPDTTFKNNCGWILPDGTFYGCSYSQHVSLADWICETLGIKTENAEKYGEENGWLKIGQVGWGISKDERVVFLRQKPLVQAQTDTLFDWCKKHKVKFPNWILEDLHKSEWQQGEGLTYG